MGAEGQHNQTFQRIIQDELPSRRFAVTGLNKWGHSVVASHGISQKLYGCAACPGTLDIGSEHIILSTREEEGGYDHHHMHGRCFWEKILPSLGGLAVIKASKLP